MHDCNALEDRLKTKYLKGGSRGGVVARICCSGKALICGFRRCDAEKRLIGEAFLSVVVQEWLLG